MSPTPNSTAGLNPEAWSALVDGEATDSEVHAALSAWRRSPQSESTWHRYHLIGDTLRSSDLASPRDRDARLLAAVRARLAAEPVVLAPPTAAEDAKPEGAQAARRRWRRWTGSAAMVAGVGAVGAMVWLTQAPSVPGGTVAQAGPSGATAAFGPGAARPATSSVLTVGTNPPTVVAAPPPVTAVMLRDPRLDAYFAAHRQLGSGRPLGTPAGFSLPEAAPASR
jgi:sigma-E factor negative regulatory protein RseA